MAGNIIHGDNMNNTLKIIREYPGKTSSRYAQLLNKPQNVVSGLISGMVKSGKITKQGRYYFAADLWDLRIPVKTVGELKKALENIPDNWQLVTTNDNSDAVNITEINSLWHGVLTFEHD